MILINFRCFFVTQIGKKNPPKLMLNLVFATVFSLMVLLQIESAFGAELTTTLTHFQDCKLCSEMIVLPSGTYEMGATDEEFAGAMKNYRYLYLFETPRHAAAVKQFSLGKYDVTKGQFRIFAKETGFNGKGCEIVQGHDFVIDPKADWENPGFKQTDNDPVVCVSWLDVHKYIAWLNTKVSATSSAKYRLPTETEWEYAARSGTTTASYWGDNRNDQCKYANALDVSANVLSLRAIDQGVACLDGYVETSPVGSFQPNNWGFFDMLGNVSQWMEDCPDSSYLVPPPTIPRSSSKACQGLGALRGSNWASVPIMVRSAYRAGNDMTYRTSTIGFRVAADRGIH